MPNDVETLRQWIRVALTICAICVSAFPLLYGIFSSWYKSQLGRAMMLQAGAVASAVDWSVAYQFWVSDDNLLIFLWIRFSMFVLVGAAYLYLTAVLFYINFKSRRGDPHVEWNRRSTDKKTVSQ
jgi:formate hydrogenlyase subunit 3/multisubunit Na+/H+ antiporter MnhD subunit